MRLQSCPWRAKVTFSGPPESPVLSGCNMRVSLAAQTLTSEELERQLAEALKDQSASVEFKLDPAPVETRSIDPTILVATITGASTVLSALLAGVLSIAAARKSESGSPAPGIVIVHMSSGERDEASTSLSRQERDDWIERVSKLDVAHIQLATSTP